MAIMYNKKFRLDPTERQIIGQIGEDFASKHLVDGGYRIIERNYLKKWGELDIVAIKGNKLHFVEVKSVTRNWLPVTHVTNAESFSPEDNMHPWKLKRLGRAVQSYLLDRDVSDETEWQFDLVTVYLDTNRKLLKVEFLEDIVL